MMILDWSLEENQYSIFCESVHVENVHFWNFKRYEFNEQIWPISKTENLLNYDSE